MNYTAEDLEQLLSCPKKITKPPRKEMKTEGKMQRDEMELASIDGKHSFRVYMRQSIEFSENFSIGLDYSRNDEAGGFCLIRCNGKHGGQREHPHHVNFHVHQCDVDDVNQGIRDARIVEETADYAAFRDALLYFLRRVALQSADLEKYFPRPQQELPFE